VTVMTIPAGYSKSEWNKYVRKGRALVKRQSGIQFELGDTVIDMLHSHRRGHGEVAEVIELYANQIGINPNTLRNYYYVATQWPEEKRRPDVSFSVHAALASTRSRYIKIRKDPLDPFTGEQHWTYNEALRAADNAKPQTPTNREERWERAETLLGSDEDAAVAVGEMLKHRPEMRQRLVADPHARHMLRQAQYEHWRQVDEEAAAEAELTAEEEEIQEEEAPSKVSYQDAPLEILQLLGSFSSFFVSLQRLIPQIHAQDYTADTKEAVLDNITKARSFLDWCESAIKTGKTDMDKALARLLKDEEGE
jgi:hypothetical protein